MEKILMSELELNLYKKMLTIRVVEEKLQELCLQGAGVDLHFSKGQEAISVGVCSALRSTDYIVTHHRTIAHEIAKGADLHDLIAEVLGKSTGFNKGLAGEMHLCNPAIRHAFSFQIVGTCVKPDTLILGDNDEISSLKIGSRCFGNTEINEVSQVFSRPYRGSMIKIKAAGLLPFEVTPEHPCLVMSLLRTRRFLTSISWKKADELQIKNRKHVKGDYLLIPRLKGIFDIQKLDLTEFQKKTKKCRLKELQLNTNIAWLIGLYTAEGSYDDRQGPTFSINLEEKDIETKILEIANQLCHKGKAIPKRDCNKGQNVRIYSNSLGRALTKWCGKGAQNKQIPEFVLLHKDLKILESFISGYFQGDGSIGIDRGIARGTAATISKLLALQLQLAYARLGIFVNISTTKAKENHKTAYIIRFRQNPQTQFVKITEDHIYVPIRNITKTYYEGTVNNIMTTDNTYLVSNTITHNCVPVAVGLAYALKYYQKTDDIVVVFFGDAATSNGQFHEAMNIAAIKKVPILLICENNGLAGNIRKEMYLPTETVLERMAAYGLQGSSRRDDGNDVVKIAEMAPRLIEAVRTLGEPVFWELETTRLCWHKQGQRDARGEEELVELSKRDPLLIAKRWPCEAKCVKEQVEKEVEAVFEQVKLDPEANKIE